MPAPAGEEEEGHQPAPKKQKKGERLSTCSSGKGMHKRASALRQRSHGNHCSSSINHRMAATRMALPMKLEMRPTTHNPLRSPQAPCLPKV